MLHQKGNGRIRQAWQCLPADFSGFLKCHGLIFEPLDDPVSIGFFMQGLDTTIINTALPAIAQNLQEDPLQQDFDFPNIEEKSRYEFL